DFLDPRAVAEIALAAGMPVRSTENLVDETCNQVGVKQGSPRLTLAAAWRIEARRDLQLAKLHLVRCGRLERLAHSELLDEPADERAAAAVDARFDPRIVPNRHEARLYRAQCAVLELADEHVSIVDVHPHHSVV